MLCWADVAVALLLMGGPYQSLTLALAAMTSCVLLVLVSLGGGLVLVGALSGGGEGCASSGNCARTWPVIALETGRGMPAQHERERGAHRELMAVPTSPQLAWRGRIWKDGDIHRWQWGGYEDRVPCMSSLRDTVLICPRYLHVSTESLHRTLPCTSPPP